MKKYIFSIFFISCCFLQSINAQRFTGGGMLGFTTSQIHGDGFGGFYKYGVSGGFYVEYGFTPLTSGVFELRYSQKGSSDIKGNLKYNLGYTELPFMLRHKINKKIACKLGVAPSVKIFESSTAFGFKTLSNDLGKYDYPFHIGADYTVNKKWMFDFRTSYSTKKAEGRYRNLVLYFGVLLKM